MTLRINDSNNNISQDILDDLGIELKNFATEEVDFTLPPPTSSTFELTIPAFQQSATIELFFNLVDDNVDEGDSETLVISGEARDLDVGPAILEIKDDDDRGVTLSRSSLTVAEGADPVVYTVVLDSEPAGNGAVVVTLNVSYDTEDEVFLNGDSGMLDLFFGGDSGPSWDEPQVVGVTLRANDDVNGPRDAIIEHSVSGADYDGESVDDVLLTLTDYGVIVEPVRLSVDENRTAIYKLSLTSAPTGDVTVEIMIPLAYKGVLSVDQGETLVLNEDNYTGVDVPVSLEDDVLYNGARVVTIGHEVTASDDPNYEVGLAGPDIEVTLIDDEKQPRLLLELTPESREEGDSGDTTFDVMAKVTLLGPRRSEAARVTLVVEDVFRGTADENDDYITDLPQDFMIPEDTQSEDFFFTLTLIGDRVDEGDEFFTITASDDLSSSDSDTFVIENDDKAAVLVSLENQSVREGDEIEYTVVLESQPIADVMVVVTVERVSDSDSEADPVDVTVAVVESSLPLTFTPVNWLTSRRLLLTVKPSLAVFGELEIRHTLISADDPTYAALPPVSAVLELTDVDVDLSAWK